MVNRWIWQEPNWPKFHWDAPRLAPVLHSAHTQRLELQQLLERAFIRTYLKRDTPQLGPPPC